MTSLKILIPSKCHALSRGYVETARFLENEVGSVCGFCILRGEVGRWLRICRSKRDLLTNTF